MSWPEPLTAPFRGPGRILGVVLAVIAVVFGVWSVGWLGAVVVIVVLMVALLAELWRETARLGRELRHTEEGRDLARAEVGYLSERAQQAADLEDELEVLQGQLRELENDAGTITFEQLLDGLSQQLNVIDVVQKHRSLSHQGVGGDWPVVRVQAGPDDRVLVRASVGEDADRLSGEWVTLVDVRSGVAFGTAPVVTAGNRELVISLEADELPAEVEDGLGERRSLVPVGLAVRLAGLVVPQFKDLEDRELGALREALLEVMRVVRAVLTSQQSIAEETTT